MEEKNNLTTNVRWLDEDWDQEYQEAAPTHLRVAGGTPLLYPGEVNLICGKAGQGKTWLAIQAVLECAGSEERTLYVDYENGERWIRSRLKRLGMTREQAKFSAHIHAYTPISGANSPFDLSEYVSEHNIKLVVIDSLARALAAAGKDENSNGDVAWFFGSLEPLRKTGATILVIDHVGHSNEEHFTRKPRGASAKIDQVSIAYFFNVQSSWSKSQSGTAWLIVLKDRFGNFIEEQVAAVMNVSVQPDQMDISMVSYASKTIEGVGRQDVALHLLGLLNEHKQITGLRKCSNLLAKEARIKSETADIVIKELIAAKYVDSCQSQNGVAAVLTLSDRGLSMVSG